MQRIILRIFLVVMAITWLPAGVLADSGFLWTNGPYTSIDYPGANATYAHGIDNGG